MPRGHYDRNRGHLVDVYMALESFTTPEFVTVLKGDLVRAGHPVMKNRERFFALASERIRFDIEQATAAPGERR